MIRRERLFLFLFSRKLTPNDERSRAIGFIESEKSRWGKPELSHGNILKTIWIYAALVFLLFAINHAA